MSSFAKLANAPGLGANYSFYALPIGWLVCQAPLFWAVSKANGVKLGAYSNANPAEAWASLEKAGISKSLAGQIRRAIAAENNNHVNMPLFAAGLVAANAAHVPVSTIHQLAAAYLLIRVAYSIAYVKIESDSKSYIRSALYVSGVATTWALFYHAINNWSVLPQ